MVASCISDWGAEDMGGHWWEWTDKWYAGPNATPSCMDAVSWPAAGSYGSDGTWCISPVRRMVTRDGCRGFLRLRCAAATMVTVPQPAFSACTWPKPPRPREKVADSGASSPADDWILVGHPHRRPGFPPTPSACPGSSSSTSGSGHVRAFPSRPSTQEFSEVRESKLGCRDPIWGSGEPPLKYRNSTLGSGEPPLKFRNSTLGSGEPPLGCRYPTLGSGEPPLECRNPIFKVATQPSLLNIPQTNLINPSEKRMPSRTGRIGLLIWVDCFVSFIENGNVRSVWSASASDHRSRPARQERS